MLSLNHTHCYLHIMCHRQKGMMEESAALTSGGDGWELVPEWPDEDVVHLVVEVAAAAHHTTEY